MQLFQAMKQRIAKEMPFVTTHFLGSWWKILISFSTLIINQAYCMWFKDAHFTKAPTTPKCFPITEKIFCLPSLEHCRRSRGWEATASEIIHCCCSPPLFSMGTFCSANLLLNPASSLLQSVLHCLCVLSACDILSILSDPALQSDHAQILVSHFLFSLPTLIWYKTSHRRMHSSD